MREGRRPMAVQEVADRPMGTSQDLPQGPRLALRPKGTTMSSAPGEPRPAPVPPAPSWRRLPHVGITLLALSAGAGELYAWPRLHALAGLDVAWLLIPAALIQLPLLVECQRVAITTGQSFLVALGRASRLLAAITLGLVLFSFLWLGGWIAGSAYGFSLLFGFPGISQTTDTLLWSLFLMAAFLFPFALGKQTIHTYVHRMLMAFALITFVGCLLVILLDTQHWSRLPEFVGAMFLPRPFPEALADNPTDLIVAITFMGMGGWACILYTSLTALGRYGIAGATDPASGDYLLHHATGLRTDGAKISAAAAQTDIVPDDSPASRQNYNRWIRLSWVETTLGVVGNLLTTAILAFLAFALLYGTPNVPGANWDLLSAQSEFFRPLLGDAALAVFLVLGCSFLLDTWVGFATLLAQIGSDALVRLSPAKFGNLSVNRLFYSFLGLIVLQTIVTISLQPPGALIRATAVCMNLSTPFLCGLLFYLNYVYLPRVCPAWVRPHLWTGALLAVVAAVYTVLAGWYVSVLVS